MEGPARQTARVGKYELVRKLAVGGMAEVFLARFEWAKGLEKTVVVKRILQQYAEDPNFAAMFLSEAKLAAQLNHPNIAQIIEFGDDDGVGYLAMEYVDGPSLRMLSAALRKANVPMPLPHGARIVALACEALAHAHDLEDPVTGLPLQLVHRDVSPDNILISKAGAVKLVDFGIAKAVTQAHRTKTGTVKGKLSYMSPEQLRAQPVDRRADIFSLGVILYELIAGGKPFDVNNELMLIDAILHKERPPLRARRPDCPPELERVVMRAMERDKELRYADCRAMHADLEQFIIASRTPVTAFQIAELVRQAEPEPDPEPVITRTDLHPFPMERTDVAIELPFGPPEPEPAREPPSDPGPAPTPVRPPPASRPAPIRPRAIVAGGVALAVVVSALVWMQGSPPPPAPPPPAVPKAAPPAPVATTTLRPSSPPDRHASAKEFMDRGRALLKDKDYEQALVEFEACLQVDPTMADCHLGQGSAYARMRQPEKGLAHYKEYLRLAPNTERAQEVRRLVEDYEAARDATH